MAINLNKVKGNLQRMFDKNLNDLIRGIRNNKDNETRYIAACMDEIRLELRQDSVSVKTNAISKLCYLQMFGYDISWASFNIVEVMASTKFCEKRIGYFAASQCFHENTDVLMLTTNLIRKDLNSQGVYEAGVCLSGLACFVSPDLARDLANDVVTLVTSSRPYVRKKAVLLLYKIFLKYPEALRPTFPRLKEKLEDPDPGVQSAAVNVICELARKNPKNYLTLAPTFFKLMTTSTNNWMLIKIIKLFGALVPLEPRLGKKLLEPLTNLINSTSAMSLLYECINTVIAVLISISAGSPGDHTSSIQLCVQKLGVLIEDADQNLKYLGLLAMSRILQTHPKAVQAHKDIVLACLDDKDESIRLRALDLLYGMVGKKNIMEIVKKLMHHVDAAEGANYRDELLTRIVSICAHNNYQYITNFEWYVSVLVELTKVEGTAHGSLIAAQMLDVAVRVQSIRHLAVQQMALLIQNANLLLRGSQQHRSNISEVLTAAAFICGEYAEHLEDAQSTLESMVRTKPTSMPGHIQASYVQNFGKLYARLVHTAEEAHDWDAVASLDSVMCSKLPLFEQTDHLEAQERASTLRQLIIHAEQLHAQRETCGSALLALYEGELNPVAPKAQRKVPVPEGLDLDSWINDPPTIDADSESNESGSEEPATPRTPKAGRPEFLGFMQTNNASSSEPKRVEPTEDELKKMRESRLAEIENNPYYVKSKNVPSPKESPRAKATSSKKAKPLEGDLINTNSEFNSPLEIPGMVGMSSYMEQQEQTLSWKKAKKAKRSAKRGRANGDEHVDSSEDERQVVAHKVNRDNGEMPADAVSTDEETSTSVWPVGGGGKTAAKPAVDPYRALDMDLDEPLRENEQLPVPKHRTVVNNDVAKQANVLPKTVKDDKKGEGEEKVKRRSHKDDKHKKVKKEKKKHREKTTAADEQPAQHDDEVFAPATAAPAVTETPNVDDLDFWLSGTKQTGATSTAAVAATAAKSEPADPSLNDAKEKKRLKSKSSEKQEKKKKTTKHSSSRHDSHEQNIIDESRNKNDYEQTTDSLVVTPTTESTTAATSITSVAIDPSRPLAKNKDVCLMYTTETSLMNSDYINVRVYITAGGGETAHLSQMLWMTVDSLSCRLLPPAGIICEDGVPVGASGASLATGDTTHVTLDYAVANTRTPVRLRGTFTYSRTLVDGDVVPDKLDFSLHLPCVSFCRAAIIDKDSYADLLSMDTLSARQTVQTPLVAGSNLERVCAQLQTHAHCTLVERTADAASMYTQTIDGVQICALVKCAPTSTSVNIDLKSDDAALLTNLIGEYRDIVGGQFDRK